MEVMLMWFLGVGAFGALIMLAIAVDTLRNGRLAQTWFTQREIEKARRAAQRPIPSAEERAREAVWSRLSGRLGGVTGRRRPARTTASEPTAAVVETVPDPAPSAADRDLVAVVERQAEAASYGGEVASALGSLERGDEVAARRRAAQQRIAAEAANSMALSVPGRIEDYFDDADDLDFPAVSGGH